MSKLKRDNQIWSGAWQGHPIRISHELLMEFRKGDHDGDVLWLAPSIEQIGNWLFVKTNEERNKQPDGLEWYPFEEFLKYCKAGSNEEKQDVDAGVPYECANCKETFIGVSLKKAVDELEENFGTRDTENCLQLCDDCYKEYRAWEKQKLN